MSYDYEMYDGKRIVVDGEVIGLLAMEFGCEVEEVWEEYHAELAMTEEQERQSEAYKESLRKALSAQYEKVATLEAENAKLREERDGWKKLCTDQEVMHVMREETLDNENAKLRELLGGVGHLLFILDVDYCVACPRDSISHPCPVYTIKGGECLYKSDMRELGVEVDG